jgi:Xaa-Pro dipeptidase
VSEIPKPITAPPGKEELEGRLARVRELMDKKKLDYYVTFAPYNIYYLTNFANLVHERPFILVIPKKGTMKMVCPFLEAIHVKAKARCDLEYVTYYEYPAPKGQNWYEVYKSLLKKNDRVGIESDMPVKIVQRTLGSHTFAQIIEDVRVIKTDYEIGRTVHACLVVNEGMKKLLEVARPGVPLITIYQAGVQVMMAKALMEIPELNFVASKFMAGVWAPSVSHNPHIVPSVFQPCEVGGPHISGVGATVDGYGVELERTFFLGKVPEHAKKPFEVVMKARELAFELTTPGAILEDIDDKVRQVIISAGYGDHILHRTGHGLGITGHEDPFIAIGDKREVVPGMVLSIEPGIYIEGKGGYRHSDTVLITKTGNVSLTDSPDTLEGVTLHI